MWKLNNARTSLRDSQLVLDMHSCSKMDPAQTWIVRGASYWQCKAPTALIESNKWSQPYAA